MCVVNRVGWLPMRLPYYVEQPERGPVADAVVGGHPQVRVVHQWGEGDAVFNQEVFDLVGVGSAGDSYHDDPVAVSPSELLDFGGCRPTGRSPRRQEPQQHRPGTVHQRPQTDRLPADCFYHFAFGKVVAHPAPPREGIFVLEHRLVNQGGSPVSGQQPVGAEPERLDAASGTDTGRG